MAKVQKTFQSRWGWLSKSFPPSNSLLINYYILKAVVNEKNLFKSSNIFIILTKESLLGYNKKVFFYLRALIHISSNRGVYLDFFNSLKSSNQLVDAKKETGSSVQYFVSTFLFSIKLQCKKRRSFTYYICWCGT